MRSLPAGCSACTNTAAPSCSAAAKKLSKRGSPKAAPFTLLPSSTPRKPSRIRRSSSRAAASGSCIGTPPSPMNLSGARATMAAMVSLTWRMSGTASSSGSQYDSNSGIGESTWRAMPIAAIACLRCSTSQHWSLTVRKFLPSIITFLWWQSCAGAIDGQCAPPIAYLLAGVGGKLRRHDMGVDVDCRHCASGTSVPSMARAWPRNSAITVPSSRVTATS